MNRYSSTPLINLGTQYGTTTINRTIRNEIKNGNIKTVEYILKEGQRLDSLAGELYNDASLWWLIAIASNIGWGLQAPPGTILNIPALQDVQKYIG